MGKNNVVNMADFRKKVAIKKALEKKQDEPSVGETIVGRIFTALQGAVKALHTEGEHLELTLINCEASTSRKGAVSIKASSVLNFCAHGVLYEIKIDIHDKDTLFRNTFNDTKLKPRVDIYSYSDELELAFGRVLNKEDGVFSYTVHDVDDISQWTPARLTTFFDAVRVKHMLFGVPENKQILNQLLAVIDVVKKNQPKPQSFDGLNQ